MPTLHINFFVFVSAVPYTFSILLETEPQAIAQRVHTKRMESSDLPFSEQSITQALQNAREQLARSLLK
jgi:hypothetical protein